MATWLYDFWKFFAAWVLGFIDPFKPYGTRLFEALARLTIGLAFEAACVRRLPGTGKIQVALARRAAKESFAPNAWHFPGTFYRPWETSVDVLKRLARKEFGWLEFDQAICVGLFRASKADMGRERGHPDSELWLILDPEFGRRVQWFNLDALPEGVFYSHQEKLIPEVVGAFLRWEKGGPVAVPKIDVISPVKPGR